MIAASSFGIIAYLSGNAILPSICRSISCRGPANLSVVLGAVIGAGLGFLWFNAPPGRHLHGRYRIAGHGRADRHVSVAAKHEIVLAIVGGLFVMEALSVIIQVGYFKMTGRRVFLMAPIHHHFEKMGWTESQVVIRFWIIAVVLALIGLSTLKLR
jgi:phospho-N-acetylmuramoyl-pentapeptide-transferase